MSQFTEKELIAFGNYLLSDVRNEKLVHETNKNEVTDADVANFKERLGFTNALSLIAAYNAEPQKSRKEEIKIQLDGVIAGLPLAEIEEAEGLLTETGVLKVENFDKAIALFTPKALTA